MKFTFKSLCCSALGLAGVWLFLVLAFSLHGQEAPHTTLPTPYDTKNGVTMSIPVAPPVRNMILSKIRFDGTIEGKPAFAEINYVGAADCDATYRGTFTLSEAREVFQNGSVFHIRLCNDLKAKP